MTADEFELIQKIIKTNDIDELKMMRDLIQTKILSLSKNLSVDEQSDILIENLDDFLTTNLKPSERQIIKHRWFVSAIANIKNINMKDAKVYHALNIGKIKLLSLPAIGKRTVEIIDSKLLPYGLSLEHKLTQEQINNLDNLCNLENKLLVKNTK